MCRSCGGGGAQFRATSDRGRGRRLGRAGATWVDERSEQLFGVGTPLSKSALGLYTAADSTQAIKVANGLRVSLVSSAVHFSTDQIVLWPNDNHPTHLFVCDENSSNPAVQRVDLSLPAASNATTILTGIVACDPIRRTPWGSPIAAEEATDGGVYEIMNPLSITSPIAVTDRGTGATSDLPRRQAQGARPAGVRRQPGAPRWDDHLRRRAETRLAAIREAACTSSRLTSRTRAAG